MRFILTIFAIIVLLLSPAVVSAQFLDGTQTFPIDDSFGTQLVPSGQVGTFPIDGTQLVPSGQVGTFPIQPPEVVFPPEFPPPEVIQPPIIVVPPPPQPAPIIVISPPPPEFIVPPPAPPQVVLVPQPDFSPAINNAINNRNIIDTSQSQRQGQNAVANARSSTGPIIINTPSGPREVIVQQPVPVQTVPVQQPVVVQTAPVQTVPVQTVSAPVQTVAARSPVVTTTVPVAQELPKTGLPFLAWTLAGLIPFGFRLRKFGKGVQADEGKPNYIWQKREFDRD